MRLPTNNIAITLVGFAVSMLLVPIAFMLIHWLRFAKGVRRRRVRAAAARQGYGVLSALEAISETRVL